MDLTHEDVLVEPVITESSWELQEEENKYVFRVHPEATKPQVRNAVQEIFDVEVLKVNTMNMRGKPRRERLNEEKGMSRNWKKAYVRLSKGDRIDIFG